LDLGHCAYFDGVLALDDPAARVFSLNEAVRTMVRSLNGRLFSVHAHDVRRDDWRDHRCVGSGVIDFAALFTELQHVGYSGLFEIELEEPDAEMAAAESGEYLTTLCRTMPANA
jgi:sugar phosphate isomerase/epimerase